LFNLCKFFQNSVSLFLKSRVLPLQGRKFDLILGSAISAKSKNALRSVEALEVGGAQMAVVSLECFCTLDAENIFDGIAAKRVIFYFAEMLAACGAGEVRSVVGAKKEVLGQHYHCYYNFGLSSIVKNKNYFDGGAGWHIYRS
jgi:hypothetical protein